VFGLTRILRADQPKGRLSWREDVSQGKTAFSTVSNDGVSMKKAKQQDHSLRSVEISHHAPHAGSVFLAGTFNDWDTSACPMTTVPEGMWLRTDKET
jgi:hypothetical protein